MINVSNVSQYLSLFQVLGDKPRFFHRPKEVRKPPIQRQKEYCDLLLCKHGKIKTEYVI